MKVNAVAMRGFTEQEALPFAEFARERDFQVRFIEFMPLDGDHSWSADQVLTGEELREIIHAVHPLEELPREPSATARVFRFTDGRARSASSTPSRSRSARTATASGSPPTAACAPASSPSTRPTCAGRCATAPDDDELEAIVRDAVWRKELKHHVGEPGFRQPPRTMSAIGG